MNKPYYQQEIQEIFNELESSQHGLTSEQIPKHRARFGTNELIEEKKPNIFQIFISQFKDFLVIILLFAAVISAFLGEVESTIVISFVVILNALLGTIQHVKAEHSLNSLKSMATPFAKVVRDGQVLEIPSKDVCVGDILTLDAGDFVCADARLIECHQLQINESALTGESLPIEKSTITLMDSHLSIGDQTSMVFSGTFVTNGRAKAIVTAVGMQSEIGKIASLLGQAQAKKTPLQVSLDQFGKKLAIAIISLCILIFFLDIIRDREIVDSFMFAVSLAVAAIPEALSSIVTIVLAFGTQKMAKENAIMRQIHAVESLGSVSVICTDKTGTLTQNKMTVQQLYIHDELYPASNLSIENRLHTQLLTFSLLCNDSVTIDKKEVGDPTELALVNFAETYGIDELIVRDNYPRISEVPFDSDRKCMSTLHIINEQNIMITKGGVDVLLPRLTHVAKSDCIVPFTEVEKVKIEQANASFSQNGLRVLAIAYKNVEANTIGIPDENDLTFIGLIAMMDPPRKETIQAIEDCHKAGIKTIMLTGDHVMTATAIAKQIGLLQHSQEAIEGKGIEQMTDDELRQNVKNLSVYARVSPEHKIRIVRAWQENGYIVAMTGDGVNDGPALKQANIGIAMGMTGTEVAKDASSMILTDDNFATIVKAISNGRSIYANIQNAIKFLLSGNLGAIFVVLFATIFALPVPFAPVHLLFINLLTDSLPAVAIGLEPHSSKVMKEKPRDIRVPILNKTFASQILVEGVLIGVATGSAFWIGLAKADAVYASTMAFATLCLARLLHGLNSRSSSSLFAIGVFKNKQSWLALLFGLILLHIVLLVPNLHSIFEVATLQINDLITIYALAFTPLLINQVRKLIK